MYLRLHLRQVLSWQIATGVATGVAAVIIGATYIQTPPAAAIISTPNYEICFRPSGPSCIDLAVKEIDSAQYTIDFEAYTLTSIPIIDALNRAASRGVTVRSVVDRDSKLASMLPGNVWTDCFVRIHHSKVVIVDDSVGTGSFNFTPNAEYHNVENHIWLKDPTIASEYKVDFEHQIAESSKGVGVCPKPQRHQ